MALSKDLTLNNELGLTNDISGCYIRVDSVQVSKKQCKAKVGYYTSAQSFLTSKMFTFSGDFSAGSSNALAQAYQHLKTLSEFSGATDV